MICVREIDVDSSIQAQGTSEFMVFPTPTAKAGVYLAT